MQTPSAGTTLSIPQNLPADDERLRRNGRSKGRFPHRGLLQVCCAICQQSRSHQFAAIHQLDLPHSLKPGKTLTLITDGVVEVRAANGELFGFERTASITVLCAKHIANTAAAFGQQDDITVLTIGMVAVEEEMQATRILAVSPSTS